MLTPEACEEGHAELAARKDGDVYEYCKVAHGNGLGEPPLYRYAVTWDLDYHDSGGSSLTRAEKEAQRKLESVGFTSWQKDLLWDYDKDFNTDVFYSRRTLRTRIFVLRDPRVHTVEGKDVCPLKRDEREFCGMRFVRSSEMRLP